MSSRDEYEAVRRKAGWLRLDDVGVLRATGKDRISWANGMVTNDLLAIADGGSMSALVVTAKGKAIAIVDVWREPDAVLFLVEGGRVEIVRRTLDGLLVMEEVELSDTSSAQAVWSVQGPAAADVAAGLDLPKRTRDRTGLGGVDLLVPRDRADQVARALEAQGVVAVGEEAAEVLRVEAGIRRWGREVSEDTFPQEARLEDTHVSFSKGCYVGQETVVRLKDRGHVNRLLVGLDLGDVAPPAPGEPVTVGAEAVGAVTSAVRSQALGRTIALAFVRRAHCGHGTALRVGGTDARVAPTPFA